MGLGNSRDTALRYFLIMATPEGKILFARSGALRWLRRFYSRPARVGVLPRLICRWLQKENSPNGQRSLVATMGRSALFIRKFEPHPPDSLALLLELSPRVAVERSRRHRPLTTRENDVLRWIAAGKSNSEMADILGLSASTVGKHLERIFRKLGVHNRTAAAVFYSSPNDGFRRQIKSA